MSGRRNGLVLVHVPEGPLDGQRWAARGALLDDFGWLHTMGAGLVATTASTTVDPVYQVMLSLGCTQTRRVSELGLAGPHNFALASAVKAIPRGATMEQAVEHLRQREVTHALYTYLGVLCESIRQLLNNTPHGESLVIASRHTWLLLAFANHVAEDESRLAIVGLPALEFPGMGLIDPTGKWLGIHDLDPKRSVESYLKV